MYGQISWEVQGIAAVHLLRFFNLRTNLKSMNLRALNPQACIDGVRGRYIIYYD